MSEIGQEQVIEYLSNLTVMQIADLTKKLEEKWGVSAAPVAIAGAVAGGAPAQAQEEAPTEFKVELADSGAQKIQVIKVVRELTGLGLKEAKDLVEAVPKVIKEGVSKEEADSIKGKLEAVGAKIVVKA